MTTQRAGHAQQARAQSPRPVDATSGWRVDRADEQGLRQRLTGAADERLAKGLGWFSIALGLTQLLAPDGMARLIGVRPTGTTRSVMRAVGVRELGAGIGILARRRPAGLVWARVGGDAMDMALLGRALTSDKSQRGRTAAATAAVAGVTALDVFAAQRLGSGNGAADHAGSLVRQTITVNRPIEDVYRFWRDFENLPRFMVHLESVQVMPGGRSQWRTKGPVGRTVAWDAEITADRPNELIAWRSLEGADVENAGDVRFARAPGGRGTEVHVALHYRPPAGLVGAAAAMLFGQSAEQQTRDDLRRFKQVIEAGEVVRSEGSPAGMNTGRLMKQRPAQPLKPDEARSFAGAGVR